jgi:superfamily II DNA or RNA helicase
MKSNRNMLVSLKIRLPARYGNGGTEDRSASNRKLEQWHARLAAFLDLPLKAIGQVVSGKDKRTGLIGVALLQGLHRKGEVKDCVAEYGHVIVDECHHLTAFSFEQVMRQVKAKFIVGLTATPVRKDGHHPIIFMQCGPI